MPSCLHSPADALAVPDDAIYYTQLMQGALFLAEQAADPAESCRHRAMAARYRMLSAGQPWPPLRYAVR